ncbi:glycosyltransferase family 2 protein [Robiginitalea sp. SC105]|uniref:glycosyltransferase family 2 protein n=1 Tax=Robiginitalea sp. SC105 TaxID=2762332 RepID=UPI00163A6A4C|nr:glycosyltransferase family 2 protein [Robiginitalea sp. SC105]MBC2840478.1 glycosyltransferase family 2 protein [Robiginitalea sp. SC105]
MQSLAVVILNWNGQHLLERFLPSVVSHSGDAVIYVADNASDDDSIGFLEREYPTIRVLRNPVNGGFASGYNMALQGVEESVYCLLNSDVEVTPGWLDPVRELLENHPEIGVVQPKIKDLLRPGYFEYAGAAGGFLDLFGYPFCRGRIFQSLEQDRGQYDDTREIFWATGACMFIRKSVFRDLQGFDADYFAHQEEVDLCWRAQNKGYKVYYCGKSEIYHLGGSTLSNMNPRKTYLNFRNSLFSITKNLPRKKAFPIILARLLLDGVAALRFLLQWKGRHTWAILRAHASYYRQFPRMIRKREKVHFVQKYHAATSIVWSYYVNQVKDFNNLVKD